MPRVVPLTCIRQKLIRFDISFTNELPTEKNERFEVSFSALIVTVVPADANNACRLL